MTDPLALWGASVATALGLLRVFEFWRDRRPRLQTSYIWRGDPETGNDLLLINDSKVPASIYNLHLVWAVQRRLRAPIERASEFDTEDDFFQVLIPPHSAEKITFADARHFAQKPRKGLEGSRLYAKVWLVGRKAPLYVPVT